jgi:hypothetical protein
MPPKSLPPEALCRYCPGLPFETTAELADVESPLGQERAVEAVVRTPMGFAVASVRDGEVLEPEKFHQLSEDEQQRIQQDIAAIQEELQAAMRGMPQLEREHRERVKELNREVALFAAGSRRVRAKRTAASPTGP